LVAGVYAFWPIMSGEGKGSIGSAKAADANLTSWIHRGATIPMPARINTGYRDPVRAFKYNGKWYTRRVNWQILLQQKPYLFSDAITLLNTIFLLYHRWYT